MTSDIYDPDLNIQSFNELGIFTLEELNQLSHVVKPQLSALHLNIRSLSKHFDELCHLLNSFPFQLDLFACCETWITPQVDISSLQISGYNIITDNRTFSTGGGVALYLKSSFEYHLRNDLKIAGVENIRVDTHKTCSLALFITLPVGPNAILLMNLKTFCIPSFCLRESV